jgi:hypothetical protein
MDEFKNQIARRFGARGCRLGDHDEVVSQDVV